MKKNKTKNTQKIRRRRYKKKRYMLYYIIFGIISTTTLLILSLTVLFNIEYINIKGNAPYSDEIIIKLSRIRLGDNLILTNTKKAEKYIFNILTDLEEVNITKNFPNAITVNCKMAEVDFCIEKQNETYLFISKNGRIIEDAGLNPPEKSFILTIQGLNFNNQKKGSFLKLPNNENENLNIIKNAIKTKEISNITNVEIRTNNTVQITFEDRITFNIDDISKTEYLLSLCNEMLKKHIGANEKGRIIYIESKKRINFVPNKQY